MAGQDWLGSEQIVEHISTPVLFVRQGRIVLANQAAEELFACSRQELIGQRWDDFRLAVFAGELDISVEGVSQCLRMRNKRGILFWASLEGDALDDNQPDEGVVWTIRDISVQKQAADALQQAKAEAEEATRAKADFLANMSHEIRTPMNAILGMTGLVLEGELSHQQRSHLETVEESARSLLALINDILDFSKVESGHLNLDHEPFDLQELVAGVVRNFEHQAVSQGLVLCSRVECLTAGVPVGDALRLRQILINLVGNALKFTSHGEVALEAVLLEKGVTRLEATFSVRDTGVGISKDKTELVFASFAQADSSISRSYGGTGLGLAICRQLVELMGGSIGVESREGQGSTFFFTVPFDIHRGEVGAVLAEEQTATSATPQFQVPMAILLAEDNVANQQLAVAILEQAGHLVTVAENGLEVLDHLAQQSFDHILMDMQMPVLDGLSASQYIRQFEKGAQVAVPGLAASVHAALQERLAGGHCHIIALTAGAMDDERQRSLAAGLDHYLVKPYDKESLLRLVAQPASDADSCADAPSGPQDEESNAFPRVSREQVWQHISTAFTTSKEVTDKVVDTYARTMTENLDGLARALGGPDFKELRYFAHALRGAFLNLGLQAMARKAAELEERAGREDATGFREGVLLIRAALRPYLEESGVL